MTATPRGGAGWRRFEFFAVSLVFHLIFTWSIFDVYFRSPVVHPEARFRASTALPSQPWTETAPAERAVIIVADGLRADTLFQSHATSKLPAWAQQDVHGTADVYDGAYAHAYHRNESTPSTEGERPAQAYVGPFLRSMARGPGRYGVSHTRVPTESRPGHVALLAGMYEDISAVTKGWKVNPLAFDSLLNQSSFSFAYGSPDIVPMFALGTDADRVRWEAYSAAEEDFTKDAVELDTWVLERVQGLFADGATNATVDAQLRSSGAVFFLHLLGLDTTGHTYRPASPEYLGNTIVVDAIARDVSSLFSEYFGDDKTAFLLTADHGMSAVGNHGDGSPENTRTPLVAWGAGVPRAQRLQRRGFTASDLDRRWGLDFFQRTDVDQADLTPLVASWLGLNVPANSEGRLPLDLLDATPAYRAHASLATARQVLEVYRVKHHERASRMASFQPYAPLVSPRDIEPGSARLATIEEAMAQGEYDDAIEECELLVHDALAGAKYLHQYDAPILRTVVALGYLGLFFYGLSCLALYSLTERAPRRPSLTWGALAGVSAVAAAVVLRFWRDGAPPAYFVYTAGTTGVWLLVASRMHLAPLFGPPRQSTGTMLWALLYAAIAAMFLAFAIWGYHSRLLWLVVMFLMAMVPLLLFPMTWKENHQMAAVVWVLLCSSAAWFMSLPTDKEESLPLLMLGGGVLLALGGAVYIWPRAFWMPPDYLGRVKKLYASMYASSFEEVKTLGAQPDDIEDDVDTFWPRTRTALLVQLVCLAAAMAVTYLTSSALQAKQGLPRPLQVAAWTVMLLAPAALLHGFQAKVQGRPQPPRERLVLLIFAFAPAFVLLSLRDEMLFYVCYTLLVLTWGHLEAELARDRAISARSSHRLQLDPPVPPPRVMVLDDTRLGLFYFLLLNIGFFGMGNVASISSFYLSPVYRLVPVFSPFLMAALLFVKLLIPFVILSCVLMALSMQSVEPRGMAPSTSRLSIVASGLGLRDVYMPLVVAALGGQVLALYFFFAIRDEGSWLDIGQSITHFVMANLMQIYMLAIATLSSALIGDARAPTPAAAPLAAAPPS